MLRNNILASNIIYLSYSHNKKHLTKYFKILDKVFKLISEQKNKKDILRLLQGKVRQSQLKRMN